MKTCEHCGRQLQTGDEAHIVDDNLFCSKECAVLYIAHEIAMNAKGMAIEQYDENATILTVRGVDDTDNTKTDSCIHCGKDLAECETIVAVEGTLFCSRKCAIERFSEYDSDLVAELYVNAMAEEINPKDIGIGGDEDDV